jgi:hypothetical protein
MKDMNSRKREMKSVQCDVGAASSRRNSLPYDGSLTQSIVNYTTAGTESAHPPPRSALAAMKHLNHPSNSSSSESSSRWSDGKCLSFAGKRRSSDPNRLACVFRSYCLELRQVPSDVGSTLTVVSSARVEVSMLRYFASQGNDHN